MFSVIATPRDIIPTTFRYTFRPSSALILEKQFFELPDGIFRVPDCMANGARITENLMIISALMEQL